MNWLLIFVPITVALEHVLPDRHLWIFCAASLAIIPLAGWMGRATEQLAERTGEGVGGFGSGSSRACFPSSGSWSLRRRSGGNSSGRRARMA